MLGYHSLDRHRARLGRDAEAGTRCAVGALVAFRRGYRLGVISNADGRVRGLLDQSGLSRFFELILDSAEVGIEKPDPRIFLTATERLRLAPGACASVGDIYEIDFLGARRAGLEAVLIGPGIAPAGVTPVANLTELVELFS